MSKPQTPPLHEAVGMRNSPKEVLSSLGPPWQEIEKYAQAGVNKMLVGNKCDPWQRINL